MAPRRCMSHHDSQRSLRGKRRRQEIWNFVWKAADPCHATGVPENRAGCDGTRTRVEGAEVDAAESMTLCSRFGPGFSR